MDGNIKNRYLGIWYNKISVTTVVWVANREIPLTDSSGVLKITSEGILVLNHNGNVIWSLNWTRSARNPIAQLLDSGNLIVKDVDDDNMETLLWQSFDYPCDTFMPEMKLGWNRVTGLNQYLSAWKTPDDPSPGNFTYGFDPSGYPEKILREGSVKRFRSGPWNGQWFSGDPQLQPHPKYTYEFIFNEKEIYFSYHILDSSLLARIVLNQNGILQKSIWIDAQGWVLTEEIDKCDRYALRGAYGSCDINNSPVCSRLMGFLPKVPKEWDMFDWSNGCVRRTPLNCSGDGFQEHFGLKFPETRKSWFNESMNLEECKIMCMNNCSCTAYANLDIRGEGSGCLLWFNDLIDIRKKEANSQAIFIRMAASEQDHSDNMKINAKPEVKKQVIITASTVLSTGMLFLCLALALYVWKKKQQKNRKMAGILAITAKNKGQKEDLELPLFDLGTITCATNNFSVTNILGEGGFGSVYKGILKDGQEIAVKRLSKNSKQGLDEFKNEVQHIAKLQHRNLVKLLGYCIQDNDMMLIYEFMHNKSLDFFIFGLTL